MPEGGGAWTPLSGLEMLIYGWQFIESVEVRGGGIQAT